MQTYQHRIATIVTILILITIGCKENENARLADLAERQLNRQSEQNRQLHDLHSELVEGSRRLVEADAEARHELVTLQRELQAERGEVGQQRDLLEAERRALATHRHVDPIVATAIGQIGMLLACLLPLILCWYLLRPSEEPDEPAVAEFLLQDLMAKEPLLISQQGKPRQLGFHVDGGEYPLSPNEEDDPRSR